jgi:hypothetical protein
MVPVTSIQHSTLCGGESDMRIFEELSSMRSGV